jgi:hypothetical protein
MTAPTYPETINININYKLESGRSFEEMLNARETADSCGCRTKPQELVRDPYRQPISHKPAYYGRPTDEARAMADMTDKLEKLADNLRGQLDLEAFDDFESATDSMQSSAQRLCQNFTDHAAAQNFETAVDKLKQAVSGLTGKVDGELHDMLKEAVGDLDVATDKLKHALRNGADGARAEQSFHNVTARLDEVIDMTENLGHGNYVGVDDPIDASPYPVCPGKEPIYTTYPDIVEPTSNWTVDKEAHTIDLDDGYKLSFENKHNAWRLTDADGHTMRVWGDPHVDEDADGKTDWNFKHDSTFILENGTKITVGTKDVGNRLTVTDDLTITKGDQGILVTGIGDNNLRISDVMSNGRELDEVTNDGYVFRQGEGVNDWYTRVQVTGDQAMKGRRDHEESV